MKVVIMSGGLGSRICWRSIRSTLLRSFNLKKMISTVTEPDLFVLAIKLDKTDGSIAIDEISKSSLRNYSLQCAEIERNVKKISHDKSSGRDKVIVCGAGTHTAASRFRP